MEPRPAPGDSWWSRLAPEHQVAITSRGSFVVLLSTPFGVVLLRANAVPGEDPPAWRLSHERSRSIALSFVTDPDDMAITLVRGEYCSQSGLVLRATGAAQTLLAAALRRRRTFTVWELAQAHEHLYRPSIGAERLQAFALKVLFQYF